MINLISWLSGKKTYAVAILMIALGILQGNDEMILQGIGFLTLRLGLSKTETAIRGM